MVRMLLERIRGDIQIEDEFTIRPKLIIRESAPNIGARDEKKQKRANLAKLSR